MYASYFGINDYLPALNGLNLGPAKKSKVETITAPMPRTITIER